MNKQPTDFFTPPMGALFSADQPLQEQYDRVVGLLTQATAQFPQADALVLMASFIYGEWDSTHEADRDQGWFEDLVGDAMAELAPEGVFFGTRAEDPKTYGFWPKPAEPERMSLRFLERTTMTCREALEIARGVLETGRVDLVPHATRTAALETVRAILEQQGCNEHDPGCADADPAKDGLLTTLMDIVIFG